MKPAPRLNVNRVLIDDARRTRVWSVEDLCRRAKVSRDTYYRVLNGETNGRSVRRVCRALGLKVEDVVLGVL